MAFFDESYYLQAKLKQVQADGQTDSNGNAFTLETLKEAISDAGMTPEQHYNTYGRAEALNPNPYFNESEYLSAKLKQLESNGETDASGKPYTLETLKAAIDATGLSPAEHYEVYGSKETTKDGHLINPSNAFDANAYVAAKLAELKAGPEADKWTAASPADVLNAITSAGMSPVSHYESYGAAEANASKVAMVQTVPSEQRVANDPVRVTLGEVVPGNYNPPSAAPAQATAKPVTKPADMGGLASTEVSPKVVSPEKPLLTPADNNYVKPPVTLVDTNEKPVIPPSTTVGTGPNAGFIIVDTATGKGTVVKPNGDVQGTVDVEVKPDGSITPPKADAPVLDGNGGNTNDKPADDNGNTIPPSGGGDTGGDDGDDTPSDTTAPTFESVVTDTDGTKIILTYDETLSSTTADLKQFTLSGTSATLKSVAVDGKTVVLTLNGNITKYEKPTIKYDDPTPGKDDANAVQDTSGNDADSLVVTTIDNKSTKVPTFTVTETDSATDAWTIGSGNGPVELKLGTTTAANDSYIFKPETGNEVKLLITDVKQVVVPAGTTLTSTAAILKAMTTGVKGNVTVSDTKIAVADANLVDIKVDGVITATISEGDIATLKTLTGTDNAYAVTVTDASVAATDLKGLDGKTSGLITVGDTVTTITATDADVQAVKDIYAATSGAITGLGDEAITFTGNTISAADADAIALKTTGVVTATLTAGTAKAIADALTDTTANAYTITVNGATAAATDIKTLDGKTSGVITVDGSVTTITATDADVQAVKDIYAATAGAITGLGDEAITFTGNAISAADANAIALKTTGVVTATLTADTAANLVTALTDATANAYTIKVLDAAAGAATTVAHLNTINGKTSVNVDISEITAITGSVSELKTFYATQTGFVTGNLGDENVTVTDAITATSNDLNDILAATDGKVTAAIGNGYTGTGGTIGNLAFNDVLNLGLSNGVTLASADKGSVPAANGEWQFTGNVFSWYDGSLKSITLTDVPGVKVDANGVLTIQPGTFTVTGSNGAYTVSNQNGDVTITADGTNYIFTPTAGTAVNVAKTDLTISLTATNITLKGEASVLAGITGLSTDKAEITGATAATLDQLVKINNATDAGNLKLNAATIAADWVGTQANLTVAFANITNLTGTVSVTDKATIAQLGTIDTSTTGKVTATTVEDAIANIVTGGTVSAYATGAVAVTLTDGAAVDLAALKALDTATTGLVDASSATGFSGATADAKAVFSHLGATGDVIKITGDEAVTLDDADVATAATPLLATDLSAIGGATTGTVTVSNAVTISGTLTEMTAALVTTNSLVAAASAKLVITGDIATPNHAALGAIDAKTSGTITLQGTDAANSYDLTSYASGDLIINGGGGTDTIIGGAGADTITGGAGKDTMTGGAGADTFVFASGDSAATVADADSITDLASGDKIDLSAISEVFAIASGTATTVSGTGITFTGGFDIFVFTDSDSAKYIVYETASGSGTTAGALEVIAIGTSTAAFTDGNISGGIITLA